MREQDLDPQVVEQTRREINRLINEIEHLANQDVPPAEFFAEYSRRIMSALAARAIALWLKNPNGNLQLQFQANLQIVGLQDHEATRVGHDQLIRQSLLKNRPLIIPPYSSTGDAIDGIKLENPTGFLIVVAPILLDGQTVGIVEAFQDPSRKPSAQQGYLSFVSRAASEAAKFLRNCQFRQIRLQRERWDQVENFMRMVHGGLIPRQVAYLVANEGKKLIECERLSVALKRGRKTRILAISGQDVVEKRANLVHRMAQLAGKVLRHGENLIFTGEIEEHWPRDVKIALERYLEESGSKMIAVVPMEDQREFGRRGRATSALVVEMIEDNAEPTEMGARIEVVARHGASALYNALEYHRIPMLFLWRFLGNWTEWIHGRTFPKVVAAFVLLIATTLAMIFVPYPLRMEGTGELTPEVRRTIFPAVQGIVRSVIADHNLEVHKGTLLLVMQNDELERELTALNGDKNAAEEELQFLEKSQDRPGPDTREVGGKIAATKLRIKGLVNRIEILRQQMEQLRVTSPIYGRVLDWDPKKLLANRPVQQGDPLLEVADVEGRWVLEVDFPEKSATHITRALQQSEDKRLPCTFILSSTPDITYKGTLIEFSTQATVVEQENMVKAKIELDKSAGIPGPKGAEVRVKVDCGPRAVGYVLFRELIDFVREYVFF